MFEALANPLGLALHAAQVTRRGLDRLQLGARRSHAGASWVAGVLDVGVGHLFVVQAKRWGVERTRACNEPARRLIVHHDRSDGAPIAGVWRTEARLLATKLAGETIQETPSQSRRRRLAESAPRRSTLGLPA